MSESEEKLDLISLGTKLRIAREQAALSQEDLAGLLQIGRSTIYRIESGATCPTLEYLYLFSRNVNISLDQLLDTDSLVPKFLSQYRFLPSKQKHVVDSTITALMQSLTENS